MQAEIFCIRNKKVGMGGQMTFLAGSGYAVERSYRRATGITREQEKAVEREIMSSYIYGQLSSLNQISTWTFIFGSNLQEWFYILDDKTHTGCSRQWARLRGIYPNI